MCGVGVRCGLLPGGGGGWRVVLGVGGRIGRSVGCGVHVGVRVGLCVTTSAERVATMSVRCKESLMAGTFVQTVDVV